MPTPTLSKTLAAWLALLLGSLGAHRVYLYGWRDRVAWLYPLPTLAGLLGAWRMETLGQDDRWAQSLVPVLGLMISLAMLNTLVLALTPDEKWDAHHNPGPPATSSGWGAVLAAIAALLLGSAVLMGTIAYSGQKFFEWQLGDTAAQSH